MYTKLSTLLFSPAKPVLLVLAVLTSGLAYAEQINPQLLLEKATQTTFKRIEQDQVQIQSDPDHLRGIIEQELMPYVDHKFAAFKVLGNQFRSVPKDKIPEFVDEFKQYLISNFAVVLASYGGQELLFAPVSNYQSEKNLDVKAIIRTAGRPDIKLNFKLRKSRNGNEWKTYDLVAEGISLLSSKRSEFSAVIRQQGIQSVIDLMRDKNSQPLNIAANTN